MTEMTEDELKKREAYAIAKIALIENFEALRLRDNWRELERLKIVSYDAEQVKKLNDLLGGAIVSAPFTVSEEAGMRLYECMKDVSYSYERALLRRFKDRTQQPFTKEFQDEMLPIFHVSPEELR